MAGELSFVEHCRGSKHRKLAWKNARVVGFAGLAPNAHSFGAAIAFEVARRMEAIGQGPLLLIVSGKPPVHLPPSTPRLAHLPDAHFIEALQETYGGIPREVRSEPELLALLLPSIRADLHASESHRPSPSPRLRCPILVCYGREDGALIPEQMPQWQALTEGAIELEPHPGGHFYLFEQPTLQDGIRRRLEHLLRVNP